MEITQSPVYWCVKCSWETSGIIIEGKPKNRRWCVKCKSPMFRCDKCYSFTSGTITEEAIFCDKCKNPVSEQALNV